jgi:SHS2 domain-containing protein
MSEEPFVEIDHTADVALRVRGHNLSSLFQHAAQGLFHLMRCEPAGELSSSEHAVSVSADDLETLLVDWLAELLYLAERHDVCFQRFEIESFDRNSLSAVAYGSGPQYPQRDIKAVTYADLAIRQVDDGYETTVTFDV